MARGPPRGPAGALHPRFVTSVSADATTRRDWKWRINPTIFVSVNCTGFAGESMKTSKGAPKLGARTVEEGFVAGDRIDMLGLSEPLRHDDRHSGIDIGVKLEGLLELPIVVNANCRPRA